MGAARTDRSAEHGAPGNGPADGTYRADVQGLRGLAVLLVVAYHARVLVGGGFVGVDIFFVISGFVITSSLRRELERTGKVSFRAFYTRRVKRLLPALAVLLVAAAAMSALVLSPFGPQIPAAKTGIAASLFASNLYLFTSPSGYFGAPAAVNPLLHMWSLSVEEQFYVVFPLLIAGGWRWASRRNSAALEAPHRRLAALLAVVALGSLILCVALTHLTPGRFGFNEPARLAFYAPVTRAWEFIAGALIALLSTDISRAMARWSRLLGLIGLGLIAFASFRFSEFTTFPGVAAIIPVTGAAFVIVAGSSKATSPVARALGTSPLVWLGDISYGWYLWHWPMIVAARLIWPGSRVALVTAALGSLAPTVLSYRLIENRVRFSPQISGVRVIGLAAACVLVPLATMVGLHNGARSSWWNSSVETANTQFVLHADELRGCSSPGAIDSPACLWSPDGAERGTVVLVGDSNAGQFSEGVVGAADRLGLAARVSTASGCPFVALTMTRPGVGADTECTAHVKALTARLVELRPEVVVIASASDIDFTQASSLELHDGAQEVPTSDQPATAALWTTALRTSVDELTEAGIRVLIVHPVPRFREFDPPVRCTTVKALTDLDGCGQSRPRQDVVAERAAAVEAEQLAVHDNPLVSTFDPFDNLCPSDPCQTNVGDVWSYRDWAHISAGASERLVGEFEAKITELLKTP